LRDAHPLRQQVDAAIVVIFTESWFTNAIKTRLRNPKGLVLGSVKIHPHYPIIIDCLKNEALKERRRLLETDGQKIVCTTSMTKPWVQLFLVVEGRKTSLPFAVDDGSRGKLKKSVPGSTSVPSR
jgi:hypothetical protein